MYVKLNKLQSEMVCTKKNNVYYYCNKEHTFINVTDVRKIGLKLYAFLVTDPDEKQEKTEFSCLYVDLPDRYVLLDEFF